MGVNSQPVVAVLGHLEQPATQGRPAPISPRVPEGVSRGVDPQAEVNGKPAAPIVLGVAVLWVFITRENVIKSTIRQDTALRAADDNQTLGDGVCPLSRPA